MSADFDVFWGAYPKRRGANPKAPARTSWDKAIKRGASPEAVIAGARAYAADPSTKVGTEFVAQAVTWLNQRRWEDYEAAPSPAPQTASAGFLVTADSPQWEAWARHLGRTPPVNRQFGWYFPTEWPPDGPNYALEKESHAPSSEFIR